MSKGKLRQRQRDQRADRRERQRRQRAEELVAEQAAAHAAFRRDCMPTAEALADEVRRQAGDGTEVIGAIMKHSRFGDAVGLYPKETFLLFILPILQRRGERGLHIAKLLEVERPHSLAVLCMRERFTGLITIPLPTFNPGELAPYRPGSFRVNLSGWLKLLLATDPADLVGPRREAVLRLHARVHAQREALRRARGADPGIDGALVALFDFERLESTLMREGREGLEAAVLETPAQA